MAEQEEENCPQAPLPPNNFYDFGHIQCLQFSTDFDNSLTKMILFSMAVEEKKLYSNIFIISYTSGNIIDDVLKCAKTKIKILCYEILKFPKSVFFFHRD